VYYKCCVVWISNLNSYLIFKSAHFDTWGTSRWFLEFDIRKCFHTSIHLNLEGIDLWFQVLLPHSETVFRRTTRRRWEGPWLRPKQCTTIGPTRQYLPTQARSGDWEDPAEARNSSCSENQIGFIKNMSSYWWPSIRTLRSCIQVHQTNFTIVNIKLR
jgi:hypothetical protein